MAAPHRRFIALFPPMTSLPPHWAGPGEILPALNGGSPAPLRALFPPTTSLPPLPPAPFTGCGDPVARARGRGRGLFPEGAAAMAEPRVRRGGKNGGKNREKPGKNRGKNRGKIWDRERKKSLELKINSHRVLPLF